ncbi:MAG: succinate dehydrogenase, cytochrome b556 subunit [Cardiobacteriaceae bacterium]|nr:succinate dehydrogenase, cytochrome b556 subunit [Cardiobacteriaceae bacterium]
MKPDNRPLSPHLQVYDMLRFTSAMSIMHRATGVASAIGLVGFAIWLALTASGESGMKVANALFQNPFVILIMFCWSASLFYHLCNGIRHLLWDAGKGLTIPEAKKSARHVQIATAVLTLVFWILIAL